MKNSRPRWLALSCAWLLFYTAAEGVTLPSNSILCLALLGAAQNDDSKKATQVTRLNPAKAAALAARLSLERSGKEKAGLDWAHWRFSNEPRESGMTAFSIPVQSSSLFQSK